MTNDKTSAALPVGTRLYRGVPLLPYIVFLSSLPGIIGGLLSGLGWLPLGETAAVGFMGALALFFLAPFTWVPGALLGVVGTLLYRAHRRSMIFIWGSLALGAAGWIIAGYSVSRATH